MDPQSDSNVSTCANCRQPLLDVYCHRCGQEQLAGRWTSARIARQVIRHLTDLEGGWLHTLTSLLRRPAQVVLDYWSGRTVCYSPPFRYVFVCTAFTVLLSFALGIDDLMQQQFQPQSLEDQLGTASIARADTRFDSWLNALVLLLIPINSLSSFWLFKSHRKTYGEHLILNCFVMGQLALLGAVGQFVPALFPRLLTAYLSANLLLGVAYNTWAFVGIFDEGWARSGLKALVLTTVGVASYAFLVAIASWIALRWS